MCARVRRKGKFRKRIMLNLPRVSCRLQNKSERAGTAAGKDSERKENAENFVVEGRRNVDVGFCANSSPKAAFSALFMCVVLWRAEIRNGNQVRCAM